MTEDKPNSDQINVVAGQLPDTNYDGNPLGANEFSCNFGLQQRVTDSSLLPVGDDTFKDGNAIDTSPNCSTGCYVVAGSNANQPVKATINTVELDNPTTYLQARSSDTSELGYDQVFNNFPVGTTAGSDASSTRDPYEVWRKIYGPTN